MEKDVKCIEPIKKCNWLLGFPEETGLETHMVKSVTKPKIIESVWEYEMAVKFYDSEVCSVTRKLYNLSENGSFPFIVSLKILNLVGETIEEWLINIEDIRLIDFGDLDYDCDCKQIINVTFATDSCKLINNE